MLFWVLELSLLSGLGLIFFAWLQVVTEIGKIGAESSSKWAIAWKWADVMVREIPTIGGWYAWLSDNFHELWRIYLARQAWTVHSIQLLSASAEAASAAASNNTSLDDVWKHQSRLVQRPDGLTSWRERAWSFVPSRDYVIQYAIAESHLTQTFVAFYRKDQPAIFPPCPIRAYWKPPTLSRIVGTFWAPSGLPTDPTLTYLVQCCAGPHQCLKEEGAAKEKGGGAHEWDWKMYQSCFPAVFQTPPSSLSRAPTPEKELSTMEKRRLARLKQAMMNNTNEISLLITRSNQTTTLVPCH